MPDDDFDHLMDGEEMMAECRVQCDECGARFEPMTDAFRCPVCGTENYPEDDR